MFVEENDCLEKVYKIIYKERMGTLTKPEGIYTVESAQKRAPKRR